MPWKAENIFSIFYYLSNFLINNKKSNIFINFYCFFFLILNETIKSFNTKQQNLSYSMGLKCERSGPSPRLINERNNRIYYETNNETHKIKALLKTPH